jgi:deoxyribonuclease IV
VGDLGPLFATLQRHPRLGVCLDTCHAFAAGHDLAAPGGVRRLLNALVRAVGPGRLKLVHANDSKDPIGSKRDRHAAIGSGLIGESPFVELFRHPATRDVPVLVETPGGLDGHARDIAVLKALRDC